MNDKRGIGFFERYLSVWVALCIIVGIAVGQLLPIIPETLGKWEYANVSIPIAVLIWLMIYPMMLKVDFQSVKNVGKRPKGILITCITKLAYQAVYDVRYRMAFLFRYIQVPYSDVTCRPISCRSCSSRSGTLYGNGIRLELSFKGRCCIYTCSGRGK